MDKEEKPLENQDDWQYLFKIFEQSWSYIRHAQTMFWQSFTALLTAIAAIIFFSYNKTLHIQEIGILFSMFLALVGYLVVSRIFTVLREHFITINRIRRHCNIDNHSDIVLTRWKGYDIKDFKLFRSETRYIIVVHHVYIGIFSFLFGYLGSLLLGETSFRFDTVLPLSFLPLIILEYDAVKKVYYAK